MQMKVTARSTLRPLVDTLPCMGAVTVTLTDNPYLDFSLHLFSNFDLMLLPGVREIALYTIKGVRLSKTLSNKHIHASGQTCILEVSHVWNP